MGSLISVAFITLVSASLGAEPASKGLHPTLSSVAATKVNVTYSTPYAPPLFPGETIQLTEEALAAAAAEIQDVSISDLFSFGTYANNTASSGRPHKCKKLPDPSWAYDPNWKGFNSVLSHPLILTAPLAASCYADWREYNVDVCTAVTEQWLNSNLHTSDPTSIMYPLYEGRSCLPPGYNYTNSCDLGAYPWVVVNVSTVQDIQYSVNFARNLNLRLVVKNTGHDLIGKASGKGALSIWTHWLKDKAYYPDFRAANGYRGPAIKFGAGIQVGEVYEYAKELGVTIVGGEDATVGFGGGYTAGGGHSPLSSLYGMAADQVLALQVVLANGRFVTATAKENPDVYWMLRGGGGSTIGVVTSLTVKAYPQLKTTIVNFNFTVADAPSVDVFWSAVQAYFDNIERFVDAGTYGYYTVGASSIEPNTDYTSGRQYYFSMQSFVAPNMTVKETKELLQPLFSVLHRLNVSYNARFSHADNFHDAWLVAFPTQYVVTDVSKLVSRLIPRNVFQDDSLRRRLSRAHKKAVDDGLFIAGLQVSGTGIAVKPPTDNAVLPAWRNTLAHVFLGIEWNATSGWEVIHNSSLYLTRWMDLLRDIAPNSGAYMSEGDFLEPNLQEAFYGTNYARLYELKQCYDPTGVFFALTGVGAEDWEVQVTDPLPYSWNNNGRLCPRQT